METDLFVDWTNWCPDIKRDTEIQETDLWTDPLAYNDMHNDPVEFNTIQNIFPGHESESDVPVTPAVTPADWGPILKRRRVNNVTTSHSISLASSPLWSGKPLNSQDIPNSVWSICSKEGHYSKIQPPRIELRRDHHNTVKDRQGSIHYHRQRRRYVYLKHNLQDPVNPGNQLQLSKQEPVYFAVGRLHTDDDGKDGICWLSHSCIGNVCRKTNQVRLDVTNVIVPAPLTRSDEEIIVLQCLATLSVVIFKLAWYKQDFTRRKKYRQRKQKQQKETNQE